MSGKVNLKAVKKLEAVLKQTDPIVRYRPRQAKKLHTEKVSFKEEKGESPDPKTRRPGETWESWHKRQPMRWL